MSASCVPARRARGGGTLPPVSSTRHEFTYVKLPICVQLFFGDVATQNFPFHAEGTAVEVFVLRSDMFGGKESSLAKMRFRETPRGAERPRAPFGHN